MRVMREKAEVISQLTGEEHFASVLPDVKRFCYSSGMGEIDKTIVIQKQHDLSRTIQAHTASGSSVMFILDGEEFTLEDSIVLQDHKNTVICGWNDYQFSAPGLYSKPFPTITVESIKECSGCDIIRSQGSGYHSHLTLIGLKINSQVLSQQGVHHNLITTSSSDLTLDRVTLENGAFDNNCQEEGSCKIQKLININGRVTTRMHGTKLIDHTKPENCPPLRYHAMVSAGPLIKELTIEQSTLTAERGSSLLRVFNGKLPSGSPQSQTINLYRNKLTASQANATTPGIVLSNSDQVEISHNLFSGHFTAGIYFAGHTPSQLSKGSFKNFWDASTEGPCTIPHIASLWLNPEACTIPESNLLPDINGCSTAASDLPPITREITGETTNSTTGSNSSNTAYALIPIGLMLTFVLCILWGGSAAAVYYFY